MPSPPPDRFEELERPRVRPFPDASHLLLARGNYFSGAVFKDLSAASRALRWQKEYMELLSKKLSASRTWRSLASAERSETVL